MSAFNEIFVTVGTTKFDSLIESITSKPVLASLQAHNCKYMTIQIGKGAEICDSIKKLALVNYGIEIDWYRFKPSIADDMNTADLIISHAGAGSCMEALNAKKLLIVVINETLMDNHQIELAEQLYNDKYLLYCTPETLTDTLVTLNDKSKDLRQFESTEPNLVRFINCLDGIMGIRA